MSRDFRAAVVASAAVILVLVLGFHELGSPGMQRMVRSDERTVRSLYDLAMKITLSWRPTDFKLPINLDSFAENEKQDSLTHKPLVYRPKSGSEYELCGTFLTDNRHPEPGENPDAWRHPKGDFCFDLDASKTVPQPPSYYY